MKKIATLLFASFPLWANANTTPAADEPKYKISETDMKILIRQMNSLEQCIFPELATGDTEKIYESWSKYDKYLMLEYTKFYLKELIGEQNMLIVTNEPHSVRYFHDLHRKLNHNNADLDQQKCDSYVKPQYQKMLESTQKVLDASR